MYNEAKEKYAALGVDTEQAMARLMVNFKGETFDGLVSKGHSQFQVDFPKAGGRSWPFHNYLSVNFRHCSRKKSKIFCPSGSPLVPVICSG